LDISDFCLDKIVSHVDILKVSNKELPISFLDQSHSNIQIDWVTIKVPFFYNGVINGGNVISCDEDGQIDYKIDKRKSVRGSHDSNLTIRTCETYSMTHGLITSMVEISGNPVKWFQGHNLFGTSDLLNLVYETVLRFSEILKAPQSETFLSAVRRGAFTISRIDLTAMYSLGNRKDVYSWLNHAEKTCRTRSGTALSKGNTVYMNKDSARWGWVFYSKGDEIESHPLHSDWDGSSLEAFADNKLRAELRLRGKELDKIGLRLGSGWANIELLDIFKDYASRIDMTEQDIKSVDLEKLPMKLRSTYELWSMGKDIRNFISKPTFYRHRKELLNFGIDISVPVPSEETHSNVIPFRKVLDLQPAGVPEWAEGTKMYFEPRKFCV
jgi:II/X family phage/plasmid replication protein